MAYLVIYPVIELTDFKEIDFFGTYAQMFSYCKSDEVF